MTESRFAAPLFVLLALASCEPRSGAASPRGAPTPSVTVLATTSTAAAEPAASDSPPLIIAPSDFERRDLEVQGYLPARLLSPNPRVPGAPVIVITHGAGGTPEAHCERYAEFVRPRAFLLCTRGVENNRHLPREERGYFYDGHHELGKELRAAIAALAAAEGPNVDTARALFFGYSQGASMGALALQEGENARGFVAALFVEGGTVDWNIALSKKLAEKGLRRVAMVCGQASCKRGADRTIPYLEKGGLGVRLWYAPGGGHTYRGEVGPLVEQAVSWLVEGEPRFADLVAPR